jgi:osmotically inducible protein OsmC
MVLAKRRAEVGWKGTLEEDEGGFTVGNWMLGEVPVTWASRTSPEELIAAAHASCYAMALSNVLAEGGTPPERLEITAVCTFDVDEVKVSSSTLDIRGYVPGMDVEDFQSAVEQAEQGCPVSNALRGNVEMRVNATLG